MPRRASEQAPSSTAPASAERPAWRLHQPRPWLIRCFRTPTSSISTSSTKSRTCSASDDPHQLPYKRESAQLPADIFRAYDIRGVVGRTLNAERAYWIGRAIGSQSIAQGEPNVAVGRDGRLSGPQLIEQLIQGLLDCRLPGQRVGMVPTPGGVLRRPISWPANQR